MNEKRFELSEYSTVYRYSVIDNIQKGTLKANEIIILLSKQAEKIDEQQATITELERKLNKYAKIGEEQLKQIIELQEENEQLRRLFEEMKQPITINLTEEDEKELRKLLGLIDDE